jgi:hypothetical protein
MSTRITVVKNPGSQFKGWMCKHSSHAVQPAECDGHITLCERCASAVKNGAELMDDDHQQPVETIKLTTVAVLKRRAAAAAK